TAVLIFIYILLNSYIVALEILIYFVVFYLFSKTFLPIIKKAQREITEEKDKTIAEVNESIRGIREIRDLGIRTKVNEIVKRIINIMFIKTKKQMVDEENYYSVAYALGALLEVVVFITCIILMSQGKRDRKSTRLNSSHVSISYAVFCLKKKKMLIRRILLWQ